MTAPTGPDRPADPLAWRWLAAVPLLAPAAVAAFGVVAVVALLLDAFVVPAVLVVGLLAAAAAVAVVGPAAHAPRAGRFADVLALAGAGGFAAVHSVYASQNVVVGRDPGVYAVTARWLVEHTSLRIDARMDLFGPGFEAASSGFGYHPEVEGELYAQGAHLLPALLAVPGWLLGDAVLFKSPVVLGALGLLAVYGFGRCLAGPWWGLVAAGVVGLSLPQVAFSRDAYTEPLSQLLVIGGLALLWRARADGSLARYAVAGMTLAASTLARVDAYLVLTSLVVFAGIVLATAPPGGRRAELGRTGALAAGALLPSVLGLLDLQTLSSGYYSSMRADLFLILAATAAAAVGSVVLVVLAWRPGLLARVDGATSGWRAPAGAAAVVLLGLFLASRPLWLVTRQADARGATDYVSGMQRVAGQVVDPRRTYGEDTVTWLVWYLGVPMVVLGLAGLALLVARVLRGRTEPLAFLAVFAVTAMLYLWRPSIVPDHLWAMRRYLPIVLPGVALAAVVAVAALVALLSRRSRPLAGVVAVVAVGLLAVPPLTTTWPTVAVREGVPQVAEAEAVCAALPDDAAVVVVGGLARRYPQTVRAFCGVPATSLLEPPEAERLAAGAQAVGDAGRSLYLVTTGADLPDVPVDGAAEPAPAVSRADVLSRRAELTGPPTETVRTQRTVHVGEVGRDGAVVRWLG